MTIENLGTSVDVRTVLTRLRQEINNRNRHYLSKEPKHSGKYYMVQCPFHKDGREQSPSMGIKEDGSVCHCFTCGAVKSLSELITQCIGEDGEQWLRDNFDSSTYSGREISLDLSRDKEKQNYVSKDVLPYFKKRHPYMYQRKLTDDIIDMFDIGYDENTKCITFPVKDISGNILFFAKRSVEKKYFHYPENVEKPLYGIYELSKVTTNEVYICESILDALFIWVCGKYAIALNGLGSSEQIKMIEQLPQRTIILALDNDERGKNAREKLKKKIHGKCIKEIDYKSYGNCKDVNDMSIEQFQNANILNCGTSLRRR